MKYSDFSQKLSKEDVLSATAIGIIEDLHDYSSKIKEFQKQRAEEYKLKRIEERAEALSALKKYKGKDPSELFINVYFSKKSNSVSFDVPKITEKVIGVLNFNSRETIDRCLSPSEANFSWSVEKLNEFEINFYLLVKSLSTSVQNKYSKKKFMLNFREYHQKIVFENETLGDSTDTLYNDLFHYSDRWNCWRLANVIARYSIIKNSFLKQSSVMELL